MTTGDLGVHHFIVTCGMPQNLLVHHTTGHWAQFNAIALLQQASVDRCIRRWESERFDRQLARTYICLCICPAPGFRP